jgi:hypothetical protein
MPHAYIILPAIIGGGLIFGWIFARWLEKRYDRGSGAGSEGLLDELEMAYSSRRSIEIRTTPESLGQIFGCIVEKIDSGFGEKHARQMLQRIESRDRSYALYPIRINGIRSELELQWTRDPNGWVRLLVLAVPNVIRALKHEAKRLPRPFAAAEAQGYLILESRVSSGFGESSRRGRRGSAFHAWCP